MNARMIKALGVAGVGMACSLAASAQGLITFYNNNLVHPQTGVTYRAGIYKDNDPSIPNDRKGDSTLGAGPGFTAGLFLQSDPTTPLATTTFRTNSGLEVFATSQDVAVPGVPAGARAKLVVRVWPTALGSYEWARVTGVAECGEFAFTSKPLGLTNGVDMAPCAGFEMDVAAHYFINANGIGNFEEYAVAPGSVRVGAFGYWQLFNAGKFNGTTDLFGLMNPTGTGHFPKAPLGDNVAFTLLSGGNGEAGFEKSYGSYSISPNSRYTVISEIGNPASGTSSLGNLNLNGFPGYRIELLVDGVVVASDNNSLAGQIPEGEFRTSKLSFTNTNQVKGASASVRLVNLNLPGTAEEPGRAVAFDKVRLIGEGMNQGVYVGFADTGSVTLTWQDAADAFELQTTGSIESGNWTSAGAGRVSDFGSHYLSVPADMNARFYRLQKRARF